MVWKQNCQIPLNRLLLQYCSQKNMDDSQKIASIIGFTKESYQIWRRMIQAEQGEIGDSCWYIVEEYLNS